MSIAQFEKDPAARLDYTFEWADWLNEGDAIATASAAAESPLSVVGSAVVSGTKVTIRAQGGTVGQKHRLTCHVTTDSGLIDERSVDLYIRER